MPTVAEMELLNRSMSDLGHTLQNNRALTLQDRDRQDRRKLDEEMMRLKRDDMASDRSFKEREVTAREGQTRALAEYRDAMVQAKTDEDRFRIFHDMVKSGVVSKDSLAAMSKAMSEKLGVTVELKMPEKEKFNTREGHNLELAEQYRQRAAAAAGPAGGGNSDRYLSIADRLERGGAPEPEDMATITERVMEEGADPLAEPRATVTRKVPSSRLSEEMGKMKGTKGTPPPAATATTPAAAGALNPPMAAPKTNVLPDKVSGTQQFESVGQAREAGKKSGDVILLWDGQQKRYRKFQID